MRLIRTTLLLGLGVLVLPTDPASQARVIANAKTAAQWTLTFCERNRQACEQGRQAWSVFTEKAEFGAKTVFAMISEHNATAAPTTASIRTHGTLKTSDLVPAWGGPAKRIGG